MREQGTQPVPRVRWPSSMQALWFARRPYEFLEQCQSRHGDAFTMTLAKRPGRVVVLTKPEHVAEAFSQSESVLCGASAIARVFEFLPQDSIVRTRGEEHRQGRSELVRLLQEASTGHAEGQQQIATECLSRAANSKLVDMRQVMNEVMARISCLFIFGENLSDQRFTPLYHAVREAVSTHATTFPVPRIFRMLGLNVDTSGKGDMFGAIRRAVQESLDEGKDGGAVGFARTRESTMQSDATAVTELFCFLFGALISAGQHVMHHLLTEHGDRDLLTRVIRDSLGDEQLIEKHLDNFTSEVFRLSPSVPGPLRSVLAPCNIGEYRLEPNAIVMLCAYLTQRRAESFDQPLLFQPERFNNTSPPPETYFPFGNGLWRCPGARIGPDIVKQVVWTLLHDFDLDPRAPSCNPIALTTGGQTIRTKPLLSLVTPRTSMIRLPRAFPAALRR